MPWLLKRFRVLAVCRRPEERDGLRALGAIPILADLDDPRSLARLAGLADFVLHAAPPPDQGARDPRTRRLVAALARRTSLPCSMVYISTTGVYGDRGGAQVDETCPLRPTTARAKRRVDAESALRAFGRRSGCTVGLLRAPGIYAASRLSLARLERGDPVLVPEDDVYTNHIHADDLAHLACLALFRARPGRAYNACDDSDMKMGDYFDLMADTFGLPRPPRLPRAEAARVLSPVTLSFMSESRRLSNARIHRELKVRLRYPSVREGLAAAHARIPVHKNQEES